MRLLVGVAVLSLLAAGLAQAETLKFSTSLKGADEVPANDTTGTGEVTATLDTSSKILTYSVTYTGLTGPALAAHFHGPAAPGSNAPPVVTLTSLASPISSSAMLTDAQVSDLEGGLWYFNIHTAAHKSGEVRGQLHKAP